VAGRDFTLAARTLFRSPIFTLTVALTMAIGIGATTAIFSVASAVLLRPLPYVNPDRLVVLYVDLRARSNMGMPFSFEEYVDIRDGSKDAFDDIAIVQTQKQIFPAADGTPEQVKVGGVSANFFKVLGARVTRGRDFDDSDGVPPPPPPPPGADPAAQPATPPPPAMAILSYEYWQRRYGGRDDVIGQRIAAGGRQGIQVVGVLAPGFELLYPVADGVEPRPDVWVAQRQRYNNANRLGYGPRPIGRLKPGVTLAAAQDSVERVTAGMRRDYPVLGTANYYTRVEPMHRNLVADVRPAILALMGAGVFLLLIACANVANLLLVRASRRQTELAVRSALGADNWQLLRPMLAESLLLGALGIAGGVALAWVGVRALIAVAPANLPRLSGVSVDGLTLAYAAISGLVAALIFGLAPAVNAIRVKAIDVLRGSGRTEGLTAGGRVRNIVVAVEVALCFVLLVGSGLMVRTFIALQQIDPGYNTRNVLTFQLMGGRGASPEERLAKINQLKESFGAIPGVTSVTASFPFPLAGDFSTIRWGTEEALADASKFQAVDWQSVIPGYFDTVGTKLIDGRVFTDTDRLSKEPIVVVDEALATKAFPGQRAVGKRILIRLRTPEPEFVEIIGVVAHQRVTSLATPGREQLYVTDGFLGFGGTNKWALRVNSDPGALAGAVRAKVAAIDPKMLVVQVATFDTLVDRSTAGTRFQLLLVAVFAIVATILVAVGLYGVLSTMVRQRTTEIGVRMALGATPAGILALVIEHGLKLSAIGMALGLAAAFALTQLMRSMLVGVKATDPLTYVVMVLVFLAVAALSAWLPARRAARLDPTSALRGE
jgi:predicted permease